VTVVRTALGRTQETGYRAIDGPSVNGHVHSAGHGLAVPVTTLEALFTDLGVAAVDVLKLDCEGAEYDILEGTRSEVLRRCGRIIGEFHPVAGRSASGLERTLSDAGFDVVVEPAGPDDAGMFTALRQPTNAPDRPGTPESARSV
jgi:hypothetical protein